MEQYKENAAETPIEKIDKLTELLKEDLDKKVYLTYGDYTKNYSIAVADWGNMQSVVNGHEGDEATQLLTDIYNAYTAKKPLGEERLYDTAGLDKTTNSVTKETMEAASFTLKDFLKDLKDNLSKE
jgi:hypothetical protein